MTPLLPDLALLVDAADAGLHPWVRDHVPLETRRAALAEELGRELTAAQDLSYAAWFARAMPYSGEPPEAFLNRWVAVSADLNVLAGPRYLGRDPDLPFVGIYASDRPVTASDRDSLTAVAGLFEAFRPSFVLLTTADPVGAWPGTHPELRQVVGLLGDLRQRTTPPGLAAVARVDTGFYANYRDIHARHVAQQPEHARHSRVEDEADLQALADQALLWDVMVDGRWAGIIAAERDVRGGVRGATVVELLLDFPYRGRGFGQHLSTLLARSLRLPDEECLLGTIHYANVASYRSALKAGRVDVGGEVLIPL